MELNLDLEDSLTTREIEAVLDEVEEEVVRANPAVRHLTVDLNPAGGG